MRWLPKPGNLPVHGLLDSLLLTIDMHMQTTADDASDELRRNSGKRNSSDGDSACSREHAADGSAPVQAAAAVAPGVATTAGAVANGLAATDPFAAWRIAQGLAAANNATARAHWAAGGLPIAALLTAGSGAAASGDNGGPAMAGPFPLPLANPAAAWNGYGAQLLNGGHNGEEHRSRHGPSPTHIGFNWQKTRRLCQQAAMNEITCSAERPCHMCRQRFLPM